MEASDYSSIYNVPLVDKDAILSFADSSDQYELVAEALRIRATETVLLELFGKGKLHGTIHTCVGQEFTGVCVGACLEADDFVTSNHRCHGHFIGATKNWQGLIDEIVGNSEGVCAGIGSSQHLYGRNFLSNGQQGGLLPVSAGVALDRRRRGSGIVVSFIGEGTLGEGVLYETLNLDSLWNLPHLIVCENNFYSQSTPQSLAVAGTLAARAAAFGIKCHEAHTWNPAELASEVQRLMAYVRTQLRPLFLVVKTFRLNAHSKGDDLRSAAEIAHFRKRDPLNIILEERPHVARSYDAILSEVRDYAAHALTKERLPSKSYLGDQLPRALGRTWAPCTSATPQVRMGRQLNEFYTDFLRSNDRAILLGEDVGDPYGGAFKITSGLQSDFPDRVISTPISEAAITGVGIGLATSGYRPLVEIMFGDFMTLTFDQLVNNASKFHHMYNKNVVCPLIVRSPMGGRRGYGPTHSQSLERFFIGIENCLTLSINSLIDVRHQLAGLAALSSPAIIFENKVDYTLHPLLPVAGYALEISDAEFPTISMKPRDIEPDVTIVSYGNMARVLADNVLQIFDNCDMIPELITLIALHPLDVSAVCGSVERTGRLAVIEEGASFGSVGSEIVSQVAERGGRGASVLRIGAHPYPIPSSPELEDAVLPSIERICDTLRAFWS
jgi:2-oxoisovalerate dehydrogenase E1 component